MKVPVIPGIGPEKIQSFLDFATEIRENPMRVAEIEAERLLPYLDAFTQQLKEDIQDYKKIPAVEMDAPPPIGNAQDIKDRVAELNSAQGLSSLFTNISRKTNSTILSEMLVLSAGVVVKLRQEDGIQWFGKNDYFNRSSIALGFLQIEKGAGDANISVPYAAIDEDIMSILGKTDTTKLLQLLQRALLAGNHDMQHHYTNDYLNETIIGRQHSLPKSARHQNSVEKWSRKYFDSFNDEAANSYESWLIMNHAKAMEKALKNGERGELEVMVRDYYNELGRIKDALIPDTTEDERKRAIDFMGMLVPYALMRFLPLDDPLITDCFKRLEEIAIDKDQPFLGTENSVEDVVKYTLELPEYTRIVENYKHAGRPIAPNNTADYDFVAIKKMQLIRMAPAIPYLLSPSDNDEHLKKMQDRVGHINVEMISDVSHNIWFSPIENGTWTTTDDTGARITIHSQNGQPHNLEGPAIIIEFDDQQRKEIYCENGKLRTNGPPIVSYTLGLQEKLYRNEHFPNQYGGLSVLHSEEIKRKNETVKNIGQRLYKAIVPESKTNGLFDVFRKASTHKTMPNWKAREELERAQRDFKTLENLTSLRDNNNIFSIDSFVARIVKLVSEEYDGHFSVLDQTGKTSDVDMKDQFDTAVRNASLISAREHYVEISANGFAYDYMNIDREFKQLHDDLSKAGRGIEALDETGKMSKDQMEQKLKDLKTQLNIEQAHIRFNNLETTTTPYGDNVEELVASLKTNIKNAGAEASFLDKTGKSSSQDIEQRITAARSRIYVLSARAELEDLERPGFSASEENLERVTSKIYGYIEKSGQDLSALDPSGNLSAKDIEERIKILAERIRSSWQKTETHKMPMGAPPRMQ